jgi:hypothetical protein
VGELKTELSWEPIGIAPGCLVEPFGENSVEPREIAIKNDLGFSDSVDWETIEGGCGHKGQRFLEACPCREPQINQRFSALQPSQRLVLWRADL